MKTVKTIKTDYTEYGWVFYDGTCRLCRRLARQWEPALERRLFRIAPLQEPWVAARLGIDGPELLQEMRVLNAQGELFGGAEGVVELSRGFWWARWLPAVAKVPAGFKLMKRVYRWVAARRRCDAGACSLEQDGFKQIAFTASLSPEAEHYPHLSSACLNPKGIPSFSPGLRVRELPWVASENRKNPERVSALDFTSGTWRCNPVGVEGWFWAHSQGSSPTRNPGLEDTIPLGLPKMRPGLVDNAQLPEERGMRSIALGVLSATARARFSGSCLLPLLVLPAAAMLLTFKSPGWLQMWSMAAALFLGLKWLVWQGDEIHPAGVGLWRTLGFFVLWPGMDAREFLSHGKERIRTVLQEWVSAFLKTGAGAVLVWVLARAAFDISQLLAGWVGMVGLALFLHFGVFHLLSLAWRSAGVVAKPIMNAPLRAVSLTEFWGRRWNLGFSMPARRFLHRPLAARVGNAKALLAVFLVSGVLHELVISLPARAGYGFPVAYFALQGFAIGFERSGVGRRLGLGSGWRGWSFTMIFAAAPAYWLFHPVFVDRVILPFLQTIGAI